jgi:peptidoglycan-N-acetylglucosamine deacetylase
MHKYLIKTPWLLRVLFPNYVWHIPSKEKVVYLTFDDGPHPQVTPWVLDQLKQYDALATFFCIGKNVKQHHDVYHKIISAGHAVGNHTQNHINGWSTATDIYLQNVAEATQFISSNLFRPPYGRIKRSQANGLRKAMQKENTKIIMWDVLSADFDTSISKEQCLSNALNNTTPGSIIVFHDSEKAFPHLEFVLPRILKTLSKEGYQFKKIVL